MRRVSAPSDHVVVVGAGASTLVADLLDHGYRHVEAIDIAAAALSQLRERLGDRADLVAMRVADVRSVTFDEPVDVWHDRATFHFLVDPDDRSQYVTRASTAVRPGGHAIIATFDLDAPEQCSGLPVRRYDAASLAAELGPAFELVEAEHVTHTTPSGGVQPFLHVVFRRVSEAGRRSQSGSGSRSG